MNLPVSKSAVQGSAADASEHHDVLRMIMEWIADRFADPPEVDTSIDWEDGEEHDDESMGPSGL
jgi:hypothetical protein